MEEWRDIERYEGLYQVSNLGRVKSLSKEWIGGNGCKCSKGETILKQGGTSYKRRYQQVVLCKEGKCSNKRVHRLVAEAFIPNPNNYPFINHKDENPENNCVENLEWCDCKYNNNYGTRNERMSESQKHVGCKSILQFDDNNNLINIFFSLSEACKVLGITSSGNISQACQGKRNKCGGYKWKYSNDTNFGLQRMVSQ